MFRRLYWKIRAHAKRHFFDKPRATFFGKFMDWMAFFIGVPFYLTYLLVRHISVKWVWVNLRALWYWFEWRPNTLRNKRYAKADRDMPQYARLFHNLSLYIFMGIVLSAHIYCYLYFAA